MPFSFPGAPQIGFDPRRVMEIIQRVMQGKLNCTVDVTLTANVASTAVSDTRLSPNSVLTFMPTTANAAAELGAGTLYISARGKQTATVTHANNAQTDRTYAVSIIG